MAKGKSPTKATGTPWVRWMGVLVGLVALAGVVWVLTTRSSGGETSAEETAAGEEGIAPRPLDVGGAGEVDDAGVADVPPESLATAGPDAPRGIDVSNDPRLGDPDAPVEIVEFSDFQCPHCASFHIEIFPALRSLYGDRVRWYFVNRFYSQPHPHAEAAAIAAECAARQGRFWEYSEQVFRRQQELGPEMLQQIASQVGLDTERFEQCREDPAVAREVVADQREADRLNVEGTPTFFVNGQRIVGAQPVGVFNQMIAPYFQ